MEWGRDHFTVINPVFTIRSEQSLTQPGIKELIGIIFVYKHCARQYLLE